MNIETMFNGIANAPSKPNGAYLQEQVCTVPVSKNLPIVKRVFIKG